MAKAIIPTAPAAVAAAAAAYRVAVDAATAADAAKREAGAALLAEMLAWGERTGRTPSGTVSLSDGRQTIKITCPALAAEIEAIRQRSVRTGRGELSVGSPYVTLRK